MSLLLAFTAATGLALGANPSLPTAAIVLAGDAPSESQVMQLQSYMEDALAEFPTLRVRSAEELFGKPRDEDAAAALAQADQAFLRGQAAFDSGRFDDAERELSACLKDYGRGAAAVLGCGRYCDALALYAALLYRRKDVDAAHVAIMDLYALEPAVKLSAARFGNDFLRYRAHLGATPEMALRGQVTLATRPEGAHLFVDGAAVGVSPVSVSLAPGEHFLRAERAGYLQNGRAFRVQPHEEQYTLELTPTKPFKQLLASASMLATEVTVKEQPARTMLAVARQLGVARLLLGLLKQRGSHQSELELVLFDARTGERLAQRRMSWQDDDFGQLHLEVGRAVTALVNLGDGAQAGPSPKFRSADPLDTRHGTEDWTQDDRGGRNTRTQANPPKGDPLDRKNGTEGW